MRVIAGQFRGRQLKTPNWAGLRPTSDRLRETLFDILGESVRGARVLDGFAGTGANGLEALSRGAAHVTFIEQDPRAARLIETNLSALGVGENDRAIIRAGFTEAARRLAGSAFDLVVLDPPYATSPAAAIAEAAPLVGPSARLVIEHAVRETAPDAAAGLQRRRTVTAGDSALSFYEHS
ncbi:MAG TPA: 16S rRNA (guanine(966)-N(2))-methyltransferase RsmD [Vicinamibacterales bacterium]